MDNATLIRILIPHAQDHLSVQMDGAIVKHLLTALERAEQAESELATANRQFMNLYANHHDAHRALDAAGIPKHGPTKPDGFAEVYGVAERIGLLRERAKRVEKAVMQRLGWAIPFAVGLTCQTGTSDQYQQYTEEMLAWLKDIRAVLEGRDG